VGLLVDDYMNPVVVCTRCKYTHEWKWRRLTLVENEAINSDFLVALGTLSEEVEFNGMQLTATQNFSTSPAEVDIVARAERNQQSPSAPCTMSLLSAPSTKNCGFSKI
jgi:hypothetical protein